MRVNHFSDITPSYVFSFIVGWIRTNVATVGIRYCCGAKGRGIDSFNIAILYYLDYFGIVILNQPDFTGYVITGINPRM